MQTIATPINGMVTKFWFNHVWYYGFSCL